MVRGTDFYAAAERRIERLTWVIGIAVAVYSQMRYGWIESVGVLAGTLIAWLNFRWLKQGIGAAVETIASQTSTLGAPSERAESEQAGKIPKRVYAKLLGRYALLLLGVYVILSSHFIPGVALLAGLFSVVGAVMVELAYQVLFIR